MNILGPLLLQEKGEYCWSQMSQNLQILICVGLSW
jgi:hypothetical protein